MGPRKVELWEMEGVVAMALELDTIDRWTLNATFDEFPRLAVHLALVPLSVGKILYIHRRLMIALDPDDKKTLEEKNNILITTSNRNLGIRCWKKNEKEKTTGVAGEKEEEKKKKRDGEERDEEAKEQKGAEDTKESKLDDGASDGKTKVEGAKTGEDEEVKEKKDVKVEKKEDEDGEKTEQSGLKNVDDKKTLTVIQKKKNQEKKE
ncbi:unnamed protein product [Caenorhabditis brenneri]